MDREKLRAEFEQSECFKKLEHVAQYTFFEFGAYIKRTDVPDDVEKKCEHLITALIFSWKAWREAKAQAVPEKTVKLHLVWNENKDECVGFLDSKDAHYTATGDDRGMFGVTALGDYFRDLNDERNEFETQIVMIEAQEQSHV